MNDDKKMTNAFSVGVDRSPCLIDGVAIDTDPDQFSILDGLDERLPSGDRATRWMRALQFGLPGLALAVATGALLMRSADRDSANAPAVPSLSAKTQVPQPPRALPAPAGEGNAQMPGHGGAARIVSAEPGPGWVAADGAAGERAPSVGADPVRPPPAPAPVSPVALSPAPQIARAERQHTGRKAVRPGRPAGAAAPNKRGRDRDVDIITAIVENAGPRR